METKECIMPFVPAQEGPPTDHSQGIRHWMILILVLQATACVVRGVFLQDLVGCCWCAAVCLLGFYTIACPSHIGNYVFWGCACCVNAIFDVISFSVLAGVGMIDLDPLPTVIRAAIPFTQILGASYAWHMWRDYKISQGSEPWHDFDPLARACDWPLYEKYQSKFQRQAEEAPGPFDEDGDDTKSLRSNRSYKTFCGGPLGLNELDEEDADAKADKERRLRAEYGTFITKATGKTEDQWMAKNVTTVF